MNSYSTENEKILLATFESALMHLQKANKRLTIITVADREPMSYGYSGSNDDLRGQLYKLMDTATDRRTREELRNFIDRM